MFRDEYVIVFAESCPSEKVKEYISSCLLTAKLNIKHGKLHDGSNVITVGAPFYVLAAKAEEVELEKKEKHGALTKFCLENFAVYEGSENEENFFTAAERSFLINACLQSLKYEKAKFAALGIQLGSDSLIAGCQHSKPKVLESCFPLHNPIKQTQLWRKIKSSFFLSPVKEIRDYYGEGVAFYFGWMACFTWTLIPVAILGVLMYFFKPPGVTVDDNPLLPFYEVVMAFWAISFLAIWKRKESEYSFLWNTYSVEHSELIRPDFHGVIRTSPITGKPEKYFPRWKRWLRFALSFVLTLPVLCIAVGAMICSLNLNGYIKDKESPVYMASLAYFAEPGHIFAADSKCYGYLIPTIAHSVVINILNKLYRTVAHFCTDMENHRTEREWDNSLIIKRVLFEVFDCFLPLFYIAFYQLNVVALRRELVGLFWGDEIRRLITESGLPYLTEKVQMLKKKRDIAKKKKTDDKDLISSSQAEEDCLLEEYDQFDDYLEMVVQFGYVTLFASAFPLAASVSIVFLFIEAHSDLFKLLFIYQRPKVVRSRGIGVWYNVLYAMMILSMLTNSLIVGFSSEQLASWFPWMYETIDGDQFIKLGYGRYVVAIVFSCEHFLILCAAVARWCVNSRPKWVRVAIAKRKYEKDVELKFLESKENMTKKKKAE